MSFYVAHQHQHLIETMIECERFSGLRAARAQRARHSLADLVAKRPMDAREIVLKTVYVYEYSSPSMVYANIVSLHSIRSLSRDN